MPESGDNQCSSSDLPYQPLPVSLSLLLLRSWLLEKLHAFEFLRDSHYFLFNGRLILLGMNRLEHGGNFFDPSFRNGGKNIPVKMDNASFPLGLRVIVGQGFHQSQTFVADRELCTFFVGFFCRIIILDSDKNCR